MGNKINNPADFLMNLLSSGEMIESEKYCRQVQQGAERIKSVVIPFNLNDEETN